MSSFLSLFNFTAIFFTSNFKNPKLSISLAKACNVRRKLPIRSSSTLCLTSTNELNIAYRAFPTVLLPVLFSPAITVTPLIVTSASLILPILDILICIFTNSFHRQLLFNNLLHQFFPLIPNLLRCKLCHICFRSLAHLYTQLLIAHKLIKRLR